MAVRWLLLRLAALVLTVPQVQTVGAAPGSSVWVRCEGSSASGGGGWNLLGVLSNLLLGGGDDYDDDDGDDEDVSASSSEHGAGSDIEEEDSWWDLGLLDDSSSEEAAGGQQPPLPPLPPLPLPALPGAVANSSLPHQADNGTLSRLRRAAPSWGLGDIDVQSGSSWSVRVFNWLLVRRNPETDRVEVKLLMPNGVQPGAQGDDDDVDDGSASREARAAGNIDVQGGQNWSVRVFDWLLVRRNPATGQVEVKLNVPGLFSPAGGGDDFDRSDGLRDATPSPSGAGASSPPEDGQPAAS